MRSGVAFVAVVVAAGMVLVPLCSARTRQSTEDAQITDVSASGAPQANISQPGPASVSQSVPVNVSGQTPTVIPAVGAATNTTPSEGQLASTAKAVPQSVNTSTVVPQATNTSTTLPQANTSTVAAQASTSTVVPQPVNTSTTLTIPSRQGVPFAVLAPNITIIPSATVTPATPEPRNFSTSRRSRSVRNYPQARRVTQGAGIQRTACGCEDAQQKAASVEAVTELSKNLSTLTDAYTKFPIKLGFFSDAEEEAPQNTNGALQNPLEKFGMCTLIAKIGNERGPVTVLVAAEDEQRMRAAGSYYHVGTVHPKKQRAFTSFCPGREDLYLTFNPKRS